MKKFVFTLTALAAVASALVSCQKEANAPEQAAKKGIKVNIVAGADTKTFVEDGDIPLVYWSEGDKVLLFENVDGALNEAAVSESAVIDGRKASFAALLEEEDPTGTSYQYSAVYPEAAINWYGDYDEDGEDDWLIFMPNVQTLVNGNMALDSDILISDPYDNGAARITDNDNLLFNFHRLGTVVRLELKGITAGEKIKDITIVAPTAIVGYIKYDIATAKAESIYWDDISSNIITLDAGDLTATGDDVVWFRVYSPEDWEIFGITVTTNKAKYRRDGTDASHDYIDASASPIQFINEGLTKFAVNLANYRVVQSVPYLQDFEEGTGQWTFFDADGDENNWSTVEDVAHSGDYSIASYSYDNDAYAALTPDNWAFTEPIQLTSGNYLGFWINAVDQNFSNEHYAVYITEEEPSSDNLGGEAYTCLLDQTYPEEGNYMVGAWEDGYQQFIIPIPQEFEGKIVYIGFRHYDCTDMFAITLDKVTVTEEKPEVEEEPTPVAAKYEDFLGKWNVPNQGGTYATWTIAEKVNGSTYTITGVEGLAENPYVSGHPLSLEAVYADGAFTIATQTLGDYYVDDYDGITYIDTFCGIVSLSGDNYLDPTIGNIIVTANLLDNGTVKMIPGIYSGYSYEFTSMTWFQISEDGDTIYNFSAAQNWTTLPCTATRVQSTSPTSIAPKAVKPAATLKKAKSSPAPGMVKLTKSARRSK